MEWSAGFGGKAWVIGFACLISVYASSCRAEPRLIQDTQETGKSQLPLDLKGALNQARSGNLELHSKGYELAAKEAEIKVAEAEYWPVMDLKSRYSKLREFSTFAGFDVVADINGNKIPVTISRNTPKNNVSVEMEFRFNMYDGGHDSAILKKAIAMREVAVANYNIALNDLTLQVSDVYWALKKAQMKYHISQLELDFATQKQKLALRSFESGGSSRIEAAQADLALAEKQLEMGETYRKMHNNIRKYIVSLGMDPSLIDVRPEELGELTTDPALYEVNSSVAELDENPEVEKAKAEIDAARQTTKSVRSEYLPTVDITYRYSLIGQSRGTVANALDNIASDTSVIGVELSWNLFNGFGTSSRLAKALADQDKARIELEQHRRDIEVKLREQNDQVEELKSKRLLEKRRLVLWEAKFEIAQKEFYSDKIPKIDLEESRLTLEKAKVQLAAAEIDLVLVKIKQATIRPVD
jgi:outer membrane protein